jgi:hypothetical protein
MVLFVGDTSSNNGDVNLKEAAGTLAGCIAKVTQGSGYLNPLWAGQSEILGELASEGDFLAGAYLFADGSRASDQARWFREHAGPLDGWALVVDVERNSLGPSATIADARAIVAELRVLYPYHQVGGYAPHWYSGNAGLRFFDWLFASSYVEGEGSPADLYARVPDGWWGRYGGEGPSLLQFSASAVIPGFPAPADCSAFRGSREALNALAGGRGAWRRVAKGAWSLDQTAFIRHATADYLVMVSEENLDGEALAAFRKYVAGGTSKIMPEGLVYYTAHRGGRAG